MKIKAVLFSLFLLLFLSLSAQPAEAKVRKCIPSNPTPGWGHIANPSTVLTWDVNCDSPVYGYFVFLTKRGASYPWIFYTPNKSFALGPYQFLLDSGLGLPWKWNVETCLAPSCSIQNRSYPSSRKLFIWTQN